MLEILNSKLPKELYYHNIRHILDVLNVVNQYIRRSKVDKNEAYLLRIGALLHDIGFIATKIEHEEKGTEIAQELMSELDYSTDEIRIVQGLIRATKVPQSPKNELECIICDSDLDYLGRNDFYEISDKLYKELKKASVVSNEMEWNKLQVKFLETHKYHTDFAKQYRQPKKEKRIQELKKLITD